MRTRLHVRLHANAEKQPRLGGLLLRLLLGFLDPVRRAAVRELRALVVVLARPDSASGVRFVEHLGVVRPRRRDRPAIRLV